MRRIERNEGKEIVIVKERKEEEKRGLEEIKVHVSSIRIYVS